MRIDLLGTSFTIRSDEDPEYLNEVVTLYSQKVKEIQQSVATSDPLKVAILAGILTADDLMKLTGATRTNSTEINRIASSLIGALDDVLQEEGPTSPGDGSATSESSSD